MEINNDYNWPGVIEFLVKQYKSQEIKENEHFLEIDVLKENNNNLNAEVKALKRINNDLIERIKMLEYSLIKERTKFSNLIANSTLNDKKEIMNELIGNEESNNIINSDVEKYVTDKLKESENKASEHKEFLKKVLNDLDCKDLLEDFEKEIKINNNLLIPSKKEINNSSFLSKKSKFKSEKKKKKKINSIPNSSKYIKNEIETIENSHVLNTHLDSVRKIKMLNNEYLISISEDCLIRGLDLNYYYENSEENYFTIRDHCGMLFSLETYENIVFIGGTEGRINILSFENDNQKIEYNIDPAHKNIIWDINHHYSANLFSSIGSDHYIKLWEYENHGNYLNFEENPVLEFEEKYYPSCIKWSSTQHSHLYSGFMNLNKLKLYDITLNKKFAEIDLNSNVNCLENLNDKILVGCDNGSLKLIDPLVTNKSVLEYNHDNKFINTIKLIHNDYYVLSGGEGNKLKLWDLRKNKVIKYLDFSYLKNNESATSIEIDKQGNIFVGGMNGNINIYEIQNIIL